MKPNIQITLKPNIQITYQSTARVPKTFEKLNLTLDARTAVQGSSQFRPQL